MKTVSFSKILPIILLPVLLISCRKIVQENYPSGKLMSEAQYRGKKLDGYYRIWFENGKLQQEANYRKDKLHGRMMRFYGNGYKELEENYHNGLKNGKATQWDELGNIRDEMNYVNDTLDGPCRSFFPSGITKMEGLYQKGLFHGKWKYFNENGLLVGEGNFISGTGKLTGYDAMGRKLREISFKMNLKDGKETEFLPDGAIRFIRMYNKDTLVSIVDHKD